MSVLGMATQTPAGDAGDDVGKDPGKRSSARLNIEGEDIYESELDEIVALGGDPSFLGYDDDDDDQNLIKDENGDSTASGTNAIDDDLWDGEIIEDAYFD